MARVDMFLSLWREACENEIFIVRRPKNLEGIAEIGLTMEQAKEILKELSCDDYFDGPEKDRNPLEKGGLWTFKKEITGRAFYIKVKIAQKGEGKLYAKCLSFHPWGW